MPTYTMINVETGEENEMFLSLSEREQLLSGGQYKQKLNTPKFISQHGTNVGKTDDGWKEVLSRVKSGSAKGNTINT